MINGIIDSGQKIVTNGLVLHLDAAQLRSYPTTGTTWTNIAATGNNGTLVNGTGFSSDNGGVLVFDGLNDYVQGPASTNLFSNRSFTVETWIYPITPAAGYQTIFTAHSSFSTQRNYILRLYNTGVLRIGYYANDLDISSVSFDAWSQVTASYNTTGDITKGYINGSLAGSSNVGPYIAASANVRIGIWFYPGLETPFKGNIAITRVYNRPLTDTEVLQNFNALKSRFGL